MQGAVAMRMVVRRDPGDENSLLAYLHRERLNILRNLDQWLRQIRGQNGFLWKVPRREVWNWQVPI